VVEPGAAPLDKYQHPHFARVYLQISKSAEKGGAAAHRQRLLAGLSGRVIELGAGNGLNFKHYPDSVTEALAVEPDDVLRAHAETAAVRASVPIRVVPGHADALPAEEAHFDAAVASLVLCSVPDPGTALAELYRALRPGGELRFYEHVRSDRRWVGRMEDLVAPLWSRACGGCHPNRDTLAAIRAAGFEISRVEPIRFGLLHMLGRASRA